MTHAWAYNFLNISRKSKILPNSARPLLAIASFGHSAKFCQQHYGLGISDIENDMAISLRNMGVLKMLVNLHF